MGKTLLITGGAGFIGANAAVWFSRKGWDVVVLDNLSRAGAEKNLRWLRENVDIEFTKCDVRDRARIELLFSDYDFDAVLHCAGQVAVTSSVDDPLLDFEINAFGTLSVLDAVRKHSPDTFVLYTSTNKVYGAMKDVSVIERNNRYEYENQTQGIDEQRPLQFYSPYGCSKGCGDQYVLDYANIYGLRTASLRQSCIYGPRQFGVEDQGWVAWFTIAALLGKPMTIFGDGKQVRDILHVEDLLRCFELVISSPEKSSGQAFNIGGGPKNTLSLLELVAMLEEELQFKLPVSFADWRPGDQRVFVCDISRAKQILSWEPTIEVRSGIVELLEWVGQNRELFEEDDPFYFLTDLV